MVTTAAGLRRVIKRACHPTPALLRRHYSHNESQKKKNATKAYIGRRQIHAFRQKYRTSIIPSMRINGYDYLFGFVGEISPGWGGYPQRTRQRTKGPQAHDSQPAIVLVAAETEPKAPTISLIRRKARRHPLNGLKRPDNVSETDRDRADNIPETVTKPAYHLSETERNAPTSPKLNVERRVHC